MGYVDAETRRRLLPLKDVIVLKFNRENWLELGIATGCSDIIDGHPRLLRSLFFNDDDYSGCALEVLISIVARENDNFPFIERYINEKFSEGTYVSVTNPVGRKIVFAPHVFQVPDSDVEPDLVSIMMPFEASFNAVFEAMNAACREAGLRCLRADNVWNHHTVIQDIFDLIFKSRIVICDFSGRNPNVFYEAGIAHTLGKHVIPIGQSMSDIPFDLKHHRILTYLGNLQGIGDLRDALVKRLNALK